MDYTKKCDFRTRFLNIFLPLFLRHSRHCDILSNWMKDTILFFFSSGTHAGSALFSGAMRYARQRGWRLQLVDDDSIRGMKAALRAYRPAGCLIGGHVDARHERAVLSPRTLKGIPAVYIDRDPDFFGQPIFCSVHDSQETGRLAALELLDLDLSAYAYVPWNTSVKWCTLRQRGFVETMRRSNKDVHVFKRTDSDAWTRNLAHWLSSLPHPIGIFCASDRTAWNTIIAAEAAGLVVPDDLAIISVGNDTSICTNIEPGITSIDPDFENGGYLAAELLDEQLADPQMPPTVKLFRPHSVIRRGSTARFRFGDPKVKAALALIRDKACTGLKAKDFAATMGYGSRRQAERRFRAVTGMTILDAINEVRFERVKTLLMNPRQHICAIANLCGWKSGNYLRKLFHAKTGLSMSEWRTQHLAKRISPTES